jgi:hypothetical protein
MKQVILVVVAVSIALSSIQASLGDGGDRIDDLYGNLVGRQLRDDGTVSVVYHKDRYIYFVVFATGRSVLERYSRADGRDLSAKEISKFLKANAGGATWTPDNTAKERHFKLSNGRAEATYGNVNGRPSLTVRELPEKP